MIKSLSREPKLMKSPVASLCCLSCDDVGPWHPATGICHVPLHYWWLGLSYDRKFISTLQNYWTKQRFFIKEERGKAILTKSVGLLILSSIFVLGGNIGVTYMHLYIYGTMYCWIHTVGSIIMLSTKIQFRKVSCGI